VRESGVHPARIRLDDRALRRWRLRERAPRDRAEPENANLQILFERGRPDELAQLPRGEPPREIHLEEPVLCVREPRAEREIGPIRRRDGHDAECVALERDGCGEPSLRQAPVEPRQGRTQCQIARENRESGDGAENSDDDEGRVQRSAPTLAERPGIRRIGAALEGIAQRRALPAVLQTTFRICMEFVPPCTPECSPFVRITRSPCLTSESSSRRAKIER
jgi:hypothetical protein